MTGVVGDFGNGRSDFGDFLRIHNLRIDLCRFQFAVAEEFRHGVDFRAERELQHGERVAAAVEPDMLRNARFQTPLAQGEVVPCGVFQSGEDPLVGLAALAHVAHGLAGNVEVFQPFGLFLPEDDVR